MVHCFTMMCIEWDGSWNLDINSYPNYSNIIVRRATGLRLKPFLCVSPVVAKIDILMCVCECVCMVSKRKLQCLRWDDFQKVVCERSMPPLAGVVSLWSHGMCLQVARCQYGCYRSDDLSQHVVQSTPVLFN